MLGGDEEMKCTCQVADRSEASADGGVSQSFTEFIHELLADRRTLKILIGGIEGGKVEERTSLGNEDLILTQMAGGRVVLPMRDAPRVEWNSETDG